jgi:hypothetical protein
MAAPQISYEAAIATLVSMFPLVEQSIVEAVLELNSASSDVRSAGLTFRRSRTNAPADDERPARADERGSSTDAASYLFFPADGAMEPTVEQLLGLDPGSAG